MHLFTRNVQAPNFREEMDYGLVLYFYLLSFPDQQSYAVCCDLQPCFTLLLDNSYVYLKDEFFDSELLLLNNI